MGWFLDTFAPETVDRRNRQRAMLEMGKGMAPNIQDPRIRGLLESDDVAKVQAGMGLLDEYRGQQLKQLVGQPSQTYTPGAGQGPLENRPATGLMGGLEKNDPNALRKFYAQIIGVGGPFAAEALKGLKSIQEQELAQRSPYFQFLPTAEGYAVGNARTGEIAKPGGGAIIPAQFDPRLQATLSGAKTGGQESAKAYNELIEGSSKVEDQLSLATDTLRQFRDYSRNKIAGTGPFATGFGLKQYVDADTQKLESLFRTINLKNMAATFAGMSRAIDTQAERQAWERTQPGITLDDPVNYQILVGNISMATKAKAEADARKKYIESSPDGTLKGYQSPVFGKTKTMFDAEGNATVVPNEQVPIAKQRGMMTADEFTATLSGKKTQAAPQSSPQGNPQGNPQERKRIRVDAQGNPIP